jgi:uncharacterized protein YbjT (DUF2867 family)
MTFIVHGATGAQGSPVLAALRAAGHATTAAVRDAASVDGAAIAVDYASVDSLAAAYKDASGVFVHLPIGSPEQQATYARAIGEAVGRTNPGRIVVSTSGYPSVPGTGPSILLEELERQDCSFATIEPCLFLENLLLPVVLGPVQTEGVLRYPLRADYLTSWVSHLDVADAAVALLTDPSVTGRVAVGALPPLLGSDLADGFARHFDTSVNYESLEPEAFGEQILPLFGEQAARPVIDAYIWRQTLSGEVISDERSAQKLLGLTPRSVDQWLRELGI